MWYLILYLVCGIVAVFTAIYLVGRTYEELDYDIEEANDSLLDELKKFFGRFWRPYLIVSVVLVYGLWPICSVISITCWIKAINERLELDKDEEYLEEGEAE